MVVCYNFIIALFIVVTEVVLELSTALHFLSRGCSYEVDLRVVYDLLLLVVRQLVLEVD